MEEREKGKKGRERKGRGKERGEERKRVKLRIPNNGIDAL